MFRPQQFSAEAQMIRCNVCHEIMNAIYSRDARTTCHECGGVALCDSKQEQRELTRARNQHA